MMMYPSYIIAETLLRGWPIRRAGALARRPSAAFWQAVGLAALGGLVMTAWDLAMDPMMVAAGNWVWETDGAYFGIPLQNYWGWWLTAFTVYALYGWFSSWFKGAQDRQVLPEANSTGNQPPFDRLAVVSYLMTVTSTLLVAALIGLGGPAMVGAFAAIPWGFGALALLNDPRPA